MPGGGQRQRAVVEDLGRLGDVQVIDFDPIVRPILAIVEWGLGRLAPDSQARMLRHLEHQLADRAARIEAQLEHDRRLKGL